MQPVLRVEEMREVDARAPEPLEVLVERAGTAVAAAALRMLGGGYGRRVVVVAGKGANGADGRVAATHLRRRGVRVHVVEAAEAPAVLPKADLVVDAAYGTGFRGEYTAPDPNGAKVLAVDIPSGIDGDSGEAHGDPVRADRTITFAALKPGLLLADGPEHAGAVEVADIGLDVSGATSWVVEDADLSAAWPARKRDAHKWAAAVYVVAGSAGMMGAATLAARSTLRAGGSTTRLGVPGADPKDLPIGEVVGRALPADGWDDEVLEDLDRFAVLVAGPGLGRNESTRQALRRLLGKADVPVVLDADGITLLGDGAADVLGNRSKPTLLTPHEGEFERVAGVAVGEDRIGDTVAAAARLGSIVLLKGPTTIVAHPNGQALLATAGSPRLATAGTGDVLSGMIGAFHARGVTPLTTAGALAAHAHGRAASLGPAEGFVAGDLLDLVPRYLSSVVG